MRGAAERHATHLVPAESTSAEADKIALPRLAVIVPVLNEAGCVDALAERVGRLPACEVVVVDGGSVDGTRDLLLDPCPVRFPGLRAKQEQGRYRLLSAPRGRALQMNAGARATRAEVLLFLHADTSIGPEHVRAVLSAVRAGADFGCFRVRLGSSDPRLRLLGALISWRSRLIPSATGDQAIFMRHELFRRLGGYRELALCEDLDLIARARRLGRYTCLAQTVVTSARRWEQRGVARTIALMWGLRLLCHAGVDPGVLRKVYDDVR